MEQERKLILDTETTGLDFSNDRIIEIGVVELRDNVLTQNYFHEYINPEKDISISAQKIHGITNEFLVNKPTFNNVIEKFLDFIKDDILIIHNADFDLNFINKELQNCGFDSIKNSVIDTIKIAKEEFPGQTVNLDSLCKKLSITNIRQNYHGALLDATLLSKVYLRLTTGKQEKLNLKDFSLPSITENQDQSHYKTVFSFPRKQLMRLTYNEKIKHENFINEMKNPIWKKLNNYF